MIAQFILSALLFGVLLYARLEYRRSTAIGLVVRITALCGLYFVWIPAHATRLAALVGIGRGVDLIIYIWVVISLMVLLNLHLKLREQLDLTLSACTIPNWRSWKVMRLIRTRSNVRWQALTRSFRRLASRQLLS